MIRDNFPSGLFVVVSFLIISWALGQDGGSFVPANSWTMDVTSFEKCADTGTNEIELRMRLIRKSRTEVVNEGNWTLLRPLDDKDVSLKIKFDRWGNGGWAQNALFFNRDKACTGFSNFVGPQVWNEFKRVMKLTGCPIPKGVYMYEGFRNEVFEKINLPGMLTGRFRTATIFIEKKSKKIIGCYLTHFTIKKK